MLCICSLVNVRSGKKKKRENNLQNMLICKMCKNAYYVKKWSKWWGWGYRSHNVPLSTHVYIQVPHSRQKSHGYLDQGAVKLVELFI